MNNYWQPGLGANVYVLGEEDFGTVEKYNSDDDIWVKMQSDGVVVSASLEMLEPADF